MPHGKDVCCSCEARALTISLPLCVCFALVDIHTHIHTCMIVSIHHMHLHTCIRTFNLQESSVVKIGFDFKNDLRKLSHTLVPSVKCFTTIVTFLDVQVWCILFSFVVNGHGTSINFSIRVRMYVCMYVCMYVRFSTTN